MNGKIKCFAPLCSNTVCAESESRRITFHKFPSGRRDCEAWLQALGRQGSKVPQEALVCSQHFLAEDFCDTRRGSKKLRPGVVPFVITDDVGPDELYAKHDGAGINGYRKVDDLNPVPDKVKVEIVRGKSRLEDNGIVEFKFKDLYTKKDSDDVLDTKYLMKQKMSKHEIINSNGKNDLFPKRNSKNNFKAINGINLESSKLLKGLKTLVIALTRCDEPSEYQKILRMQSAERKTPHKLDKQCKKGRQSVGSKMQSEKHKTKKKSTRKQIMFPCDYCKHVSKTKQASDHHLRTHTGETPYACTYCDYKSSSKLSLNIHTAKHTGEKISCHICGKEFIHKAYLASHIRIHASEKPYSCDFCEYKCIVKHSLRVHMTKHTGVYDFSCHICNKQFADKTKLVQHTKTHTGEQPFSCDQCSFKTNSKRALVIHTLIHTGVRKHSCDLCPYKFRTGSALTRHMRTHTGEKPYSCAHCTLKFARRCTLIDHLNSHTGAKPYSCKVCPSKFSSSSGLYLHKRIHSGERKFQCSVCHSSHIRKSHLKLHMMCHTGETPFPCKYCDYKSASKMYLIYHMESHTRKKKLRCNDCEYSCWTTGALRSHTRKHTGETPYTCEQYEFRTTTYRRLKGHMKTHWLA